MYLFLVLTDFTAVADTFGVLTAELQKELVCITDTCVSKMHCKLVKNFVTVLQHSVLQ